MASPGQLDLFAPKPFRDEWRDGEERGLNGRIGTARIAIRVAKMKDGFRWRGEFNSPVFGTSLPWSRRPRESAADAFAEASEILREWLARNHDREWEKRFARWIDSKSAFDLAA